MVNEIEATVLADLLHLVEPPRDAIALTTVLRGATHPRLAMVYSRGPRGAFVAVGEAGGIVTIPPASTAEVGTEWRIGAGDVMLAAATVEIVKARRAGSGADGRVLYRAFTRGAVVAASSLSHAGPLTGAMAAR